MNSPRRQNAGSLPTHCVATDTRECKAMDKKSLTKRADGLPSVAEQHRIVAKVTELVALCDQLKARIAAARAKHAQQAEALVAQVDVGTCAKGHTTIK